MRPVTSTAAPFAKGGSFIGTASYFPQYNRRANRIITLQDRLAECFLYSMNGRPPNYASKQMVGLVSVYRVAFARNAVALDAVAGESFHRTAAVRFAGRRARRDDLQAAVYRSAIRPAAPASPVHFRRCGATRPFNNGAGMAHIDRMTGFVMHNMPKNAPGSLSLQDSYDVSGYVLSHARPAFAGKTLVENSPLPADYY